MDKRSFGSRVCILAESNNLEQIAVNRIINSYISSCREDLLNGTEVGFFELVDLIPSNINSDYKLTSAGYAKRCAKTTGYPYHTVLSVIRGYLDSLRDDLMSGKNIDIRSIVSLHPICKNDEVIKVHASISTSIKEDLQRQNKCEFSVRAYTCKSLKTDIAQRRSYDTEAALA